jgi:hypothetical protein
MTKGFGRNLWKEQGILGIPGIPKFLGRFGADSVEGLSKELSGIPSGSFQSNLNLN